MNRVLAVGLLIVLAGNVAYAQDPDEGRTMEQDRERVQENTSPFDPGFFLDQQKQHFALVVSIQDGEIVRDELRVETRPGNMPAYAGGPFRVEYLDANGELLGAYSREDPLSVRSCEAQEVSRMTDGTVDVLLPRDRSIATVRFYEQERIVSELDVVGLLEDEPTREEERPNESNG